MGTSVSTNQRLAQGIGALPALERLRDAAAERSAYLVGGAVRDILLGRPRTDVDVVVEGDAVEVAERLGGEGVSHERFSTATAEVDGLTIDLASARAETYPAPGALPEVTPAPLADDLGRRDFTVNAMAVPLQGQPELIDAHGGEADLEARVLRVLHPRSFVDDPTRALRAARYATRLGFELEASTEPLLRAADLGTVSPDRLTAELRRLASEPNPRPPLELAAEWGLIELPPGAPDVIDRLSAMLSEPDWRDVVTLPDAILAILDGGGDAALAESRPERPSEAVELAADRTGVELALARGAGAEWLDRYLADWRDVRLEIDGEDLLAEGVPEGPAVGRGLKAALAKKLDGELSGRNAELAAALAAAREPA